jgi:single-stranded-DNA-specific exonuclease
MDSLKTMPSGSEGGLTDPQGWGALQEAGQLIRQACKDGRRLAVWGHDDIDGIASTLIVLDALRGLTEPIYYIPPKTSGHYGLDLPVIDRLREMGVGLLITVDSGISSLREAEYARDRGLQLIITDHHELPEKLPPADCLINPKISQPGRAGQDLAGAGVSLYLAAAIEGLGGKGWLDKNPARNGWAALATISDRVPMAGDNWHIVRSGLGCLENDPALVWLNELLGISNPHGLSPKMVSETYVGLLSSGISDGFKHQTVELFRGTIDPARWRELYAAEQLWLNRLEDETAARAHQAAKDPSPIKLVVDRDLPWSLVGPLAGGIRDRTGQPAVVLGTKNGLTAGECRGYEPFDLVAMLSGIRELFLQHGGHKQAAGFTLKSGREAELMEAVKRYGQMNAGLIMRSRPSNEVDFKVRDIAGMEQHLPGIRDQAPYGPRHRPPLCQFAELSLPDYAQAKDRFWLNYLAANRENREFVPRPALATIDSTHRGNLYLDLVSVNIT